MQPSILSMSDYFRMACVVYSWHCIRQLVEPGSLCRTLLRIRDLFDVLAGELGYHRLAEPSLQQLLRDIVITLPITSPGWEGKVGLRGWGVPLGVEGKKTLQWHKLSTRTRVRAGPSETPQVSRWSVLIHGDSYSLKFFRLHIHLSVYLLYCNVLKSHANL